MTSRTAPGARGFSVAELLAVIAVTVIMGALAYSAHRTHAVRAQVEEGVATARKSQGSVADAFRRLGEAPVNGSEPVKGDHGGGFVASITIEDGRIDVVYGGRADQAIAGRRLSLTPYETATLEVVWLCGRQVPGPGLQPLGFAGGGRQAVPVAPTIEPRFLPAGCR